jgi:hypothetical protein
MTTVTFSQDVLRVSVPATDPLRVTVANRPMVVSISPRGLQGIPGPAGPTLPIVFGRRGMVPMLEGGLNYRFPFAARLIGYSAAMGFGTPPRGADIIVNFLLNNAIVATLTVPDGDEDVPEVPMSIVVATGDHLTVDIIQVGSTSSGEDLSIFIRYEV